MESLHQRFESWFREQRNKIKVSWPYWKLPWFNEREQRKKLQEEYNRKKQQLQNLCSSVLADSVSDLQDILCSMVLSECVYKRPASEIVRVVNKFKADFGGQVVSLERVQPSLDHVPHRYLLAEAGDTLFASFIGTKQYKDVIADVNILQGAIFHEDFADFTEEDADQVDDQFKAGENMGKPLQAKPDLQKIKSKPAAHRGFLARAKGIPALELFRLAQKKNRKLVLCGHSLGGAVAVLATLAILRVVASSSSSKENEKVQVKCITFSQPPVGNAALRDYVIRKGWQHYFKTYCIPEDLVPRILSPAYFHHYSSQALQNAVDVGNGSSMEKSEDGADISRTVKPKENEGEQLVLGLGPVQNSFWRLSRLVPLEGVRKQLDRFKGKRNDSLVADPSLPSRIDEAEAAPQSLEIQEGSDGISLTLFSNTDKGTPDETKSNNTTGRSNTRSGESKRWRRVPSLPSYVPFGQLYLLGNSSVESLSVSEYSKLTSVRSVIVELRERFQSHSMKSYRSRFQKIYELCMGIDASPILGVEQLPHFPYLQQWLGLAVAGTVELGHIVEPPVVQTATSLVPLGWTGVPGDKNRQEPLKVDIIGSGLHLCTLVQAKVNGIWCSTMVESLPSTLTDSSNLSIHPGLQKMRVLIGAPLKQSPRQLIPTDSLVSGFPSDVDPVKLYMGSSEGESIRVESLSNFFIYCTSDFITVSKEVYVKTRRVRLIGLEGAGKTSLYNAILGQIKLTTAVNLDKVNPDPGKTSLYNAILGQIKLTTAVNLDKVNPDPDPQEGITGGLCYSDSAGVNLQELNLEVGHFREELWMGLRDLSRKTDLVVLVHNLSHKIPRVHQSESQLQPALSLLLNEAMAVGIPWVLAITNKFSVSAHQQKSAINAVVQAYKASPSMTEVVNSCPYVAPISGGGSDPFQERSSAACEGGDSSRMVAAQRFILAPINLVRMPFQKKALVLPVEGVTSLCQLIHRVLLSHEENTFQELARERLVLEVAIEKLRAAAASKGSKGKVSSKTAAAVGASLGAGLGIVLAIVMGAASALRKP